MALNLDAMRAKLELSATVGENKTPQSGVRKRVIKRSAFFQLLMVILLRVPFHYNLGKNPGILCNKRTHGEECPICDFASKLWRDGVDNNDDRAREKLKRCLLVNAIIHQSCPRKNQKV